MPKPSELISLYVALSGLGSICRLGSATRPSLPVPAGTSGNGSLARGVLQRPIGANSRYLLHDQGDVQRIDYIHQHR